MANAIFGEARLPLSDGRELTIRFDFNALAEAEEAANKGMKEMMQEMKGSPRLKTARAMLFGALRHHHEDITLDDAGDILSADGAAVSEAMGEAMSNMAARQTGGDANPRNGATVKPKPRGTGTRSSKSGAKRG